MESAKAGPRAGLRRRGGIAHAPRMTAGAGDAPSGTMRPILWIVLASALAHLWCLGSVFYMDDGIQILRNESLQRGEFWNPLAVAWTQLWYFLQYRIFGLSVVGFHAVNWLLHTAVAAVFYLTARRLMGNACAGLALFAALLFVVHPLGSEIPNYVRTQDLAWVTLFSLGACLALLIWQETRRIPWLGGMALCVAGATISKGPGLFHAGMMLAAVAVVSVKPEQGRAMLRHWKKIALGALVVLLGLWFGGLLKQLLGATDKWDEPRFIGHGYTVCRVFWEFAWRGIVPIKLSSDHHIAETLFPPGRGLFAIPDTRAVFAALGLVAVTLTGMRLMFHARWKLIGLCLFLFAATMLFRIAYLIPEFMPEYRIYPGLPWFCLGLALLLGGLWRKCLAKRSPLAAAVILLACFAALSAKRSVVWHDLDRLCADVLRQYPAQARAIWELHDRDARAQQWQAIIDRQEREFPKVFKAFMETNKRLAPKRELPTGHFALADIACRGRYAVALTHVKGPAAGLAEIRRTAMLVQQLGISETSNPAVYGHFIKARDEVLLFSKTP